KNSLDVNGRAAFGSLPTGQIPIANSAYFSGNVGIGNSNPTLNLTVTGTGQISTSLTVGATTATKQAFEVSGTSAFGTLPAGALPIANSASFSTNVGIATTNPLQKLSVVGSIRQTGCITAGNLNANTSGDIICSASDTRLKDVQGNYAGGLTELSQINPIVFNWKSGIDMDLLTHVGFSAQNVHTVLPEATPLMTGGSQAGYYSFDSTAVLALTVNSVKQQQSQIQLQASQLTNMQGNLDSLGTSPTGYSKLEIDNLLGPIASQVNTVQSQLDLIGIGQTAMSTQITSIQSDVAAIKELLGLSPVNQSSESSESSQSSESTQSTSAPTTITGMLAQMLNTMSDFKSMIQTLGLSNDNGKLAVTTDLTVLGDTTLANTTITGDLNVGLMKIDSLNNSISILGPACYNGATGDKDDSLCGAQTLYLQKELAGNVNFANGAVVITPDGNLNVTGTINADKVLTNELAVKAASKNIGSGTILTGTKDVIINTSAVKANSKIFVTATTSTGIRALYVSNKTPDTSFTVSVDVNAATPITFDWWIVNVE
ncbi:MAG TPA: tail fiber domain-containing protein, partial [Candidatus Saccharimonadales bacterium]|nr:tail fiber domain-containing protein [Candidatus Saccharimonadales bacterium]